MKVIGVLCRKGGVGKTTHAIHLAVQAQQAGVRALLADLDPQGSAAPWPRSTCPWRQSLSSVVPHSPRPPCQA